MRPLKRATIWRLAAAAAVVTVAGTGIAALVRPKSVDVETARAARADLLVTVDAEGRTRVRDRFVVVAPVAGRVERIAFVEGSAVGVGDIVARLTPAPLDRRTAAEGAARLAAARSLHADAASRVTQARARLADAERNAERYGVLLDAGAVAPRDRERAELERRVLADELAGAESRARAAASDVEAVRASLLAGGGADGAAATPVRAPAAGRVLRVPEPSERVVAAGTPLIEIGDAHTLEVVADALSADAVRVRPGAMVMLDGWGGEAPIRGRVRRIEPSGFTKVSALGVEEQRVNVIIDVDDCPDALGDGFRVEARIVVAERRGALTVPASALFRSTSGGWGVFVVERGVARRRDATVGQSAGGVTELLGGVREGETLIVFPSDRIADGVRVRAR